MLDAVKLIVIPVFMCVVCYMFGTLLSVKIKNGTGEKIVLGFIGVITLFQIVALPFMYFESSVTWLYNICVGFVIVLLIFYIGYVVKSGNWKHTQYEISLLNKKLKRKEIVFWAVIIGLVLYQVFYVVYFQHSDSDDSYYIAQINTILETNYLMNVEPTTGIDGFNQLVTYKLIGHEVMLSMIAKMFNVNAAFLSHMIMPVFMIPLHYIVVYQLGKGIKSEYKNLFLLFSIFVNLFSAFSGAAAPAWLLFRIWQGKAVLVSILLPILLLEFVKVYKEKTVSMSSLIILTSMLWAGFYASTVGLFLVPIVYFAYTATYFFTYKDWKNSFKLCIPVFLSLPYVLVKLVSFLSQSYFSGISDTEILFTYKDIFFAKYLSKEYGVNGNYVLAAMLLFAILYIWKKGTRVEKMAFVYMPIVLFLTFLNPLFKPFVGTYLMGEDVYYRLFWLLNFRYIAVIAMIIYVLEEVGRKFVSVLIMAFLIAGTGEYILQPSYFIDRQNRYKLSDRVIWISDEIIEENDPENNYLLMPDKYSWEVRQYTGKVRMVWGRYTHHFYDEIDYSRLENLYNRLYSNKVWRVEWLQDELEYFHVNYLYLDSEALDKNQISEEWEVLLEEDDYTLFKIK